MRTCLVHVLAFVAAACLATGAAAQVTPGKIAITSLVGDTLNLSQPRELVGTNIGRAQVSSVPMPEPTFDHAVLQSAQDALKRVAPGAQVALLRVPSPGSSSDPAQFFTDGLVDAKNPVIAALREQGYGHVVAVIKLRDTNRVRLGDDDVGFGQLEGLGFYIDKRIAVRYRDQAGSYQGIVAPHAYIQLILIDLQANQVRAIEKIAASSTVSAARSRTGDDPWNALTAEEKMSAIESLIRREVSRAVPKLLAGN